MDLSHTDAGPRGPVRLVLDRSFGALFLGKLVAMAGMWMHTVAAAIVIYEQTRSASTVALVSVAQFTPQLLLTPLSGSLADRGHRPAQIIAGRILCAVGSGASGCAFLLFDLEPGALVAAVVASSAVVGLGFVLGGPAMQSIVPDLVRPDELPAAMTLNSVPVTVGRIAGPVAGAYAVAHLGAGPAFLISAATHLTMVALLVWARLPSSGSAASPVDRSVRAGLVHAWSDRRLRVALLITIGLAIGSEPTVTLAPALADRLGGGSRLVGLLSLGVGCGALIGTVTLGPAMRRIRPSTVARWGLVLLAASGLVVAVANNLTVCLIAFGVAGTGITWSITGSSTSLQQHADPQYRGRVMALWLVAFIGTRPFVAGSLGALADLTTVGVAFGASSGLVLTVVVVSLARRRRRA